MRTLPFRFTSLRAGAFALAVAYGLSSAPPPARASSLSSFALEGGELSLPVPADWQAAPDLMGMPLMLLGPELGGARPVVSVTPVARAGVTLTRSDFEKDQAGYRAGREQWLKSRGGQAIEFYPYANRKLASGAESHAIGYRYRLGGTEYAERSYFIVCENRLYHLKTLLRAAQLGRDRATVDEMAAGFRCRRP